MPPPRQASRPRKQQTRIQFQPLPTSSPDKSAYSSAIHDRLANVRYGGVKQKSARQTRSMKADGERTLPTPEPSSQPETNEIQVSSPLGSLHSSSTPPEQNRNSAPTSDDDEDEDDLVLASSKRRRTGMVSEAATKTETPTRQSSRLKPSTAHNLNVSSPLQPAIDIPASSSHSLADLGSAETSGDEDDVLVTQPTSRRKRVQSNLSDPFVVNDDQVNYISSDDEPVRQRRLSGRRAVDDFVADDDDVEYMTSDGDGNIQASKTSKRSSTKKGRSRRDQDELEEDLLNLQDSDQEASARRRRTRGGPVNTERDRTRQHFNLLRRRRAGEKISRLPDSEDEENFDDDDGVDIDNIVYGSEPRNQLIGGDVIGSSSESEQEQEQVVEAVDEDDFVVEDAEDVRSRPLGRPHPDMPLAFTSYASRKPKELFIHVVEWLVKNKIAPAFSRNDELYQLSWDRVNDQIKAQAGSRLISSAWNAEFKNAVLARPNVEISLVGELDEELFQNCDACNRTNHPAKYEFKFSGEAYHQETLEPIDHSEDEAEDDDAASYDQAGHQLPPQSTLFYLGRFCAANAEMGHKLTHWKYHLNESLLAYLEEQGVLSAASIVARDKLNKKKKEREAESIVDSMEATGEIARMWQELQDDLEDARFGMEGHEARGGRRNAARIGKVRVNKGNGRIEEWSEGGRKRIVLQTDSEGE